MRAETGDEKSENMGKGTYVMDNEDMQEGECEGRGGKGEDRAIAILLVQKKTMGFMKSIKTCAYPR